jgi:putative sigma-54 modulation protein
MNQANDIRFQAIDFHAGEELKSLVSEKVSKFFNMSGVQHADVKLFSEGKEPHIHVCELRLSIPGHDPFVKKNGANYEEAIAECVEAMHKVMRRREEQFQPTVNPDELNDEAEEEDDYTS